jgi:hypothetical protein
MGSWAVRKPGDPWVALGRVPAPSKGNRGHLDKPMSNRTAARSIAAAVAMVMAGVLLFYALVYG